MVQPAFEGADISDATGAFVQGQESEGSAEAGKPVQIAASEAGTVRRLEANSVGGLLVSPVVNSAFADGNTASPRVTRDQDNTLAIPVVHPVLEAPDGNFDQLRSSGDSGPGLGAQNVAPVGGDISLRASAVAGEASGTSTAVDNLGWVKRLHAVLDVTAVPTGGTPTLDVYVQTQMGNGDWQDIAHFTQVVGSTTKEMLAWKGPGATEAGTQAEAAAVTVDNFFTNEDAALAATTVRLLPLGDSLRVKWVFAAGGSTGDYTFSVDIAAHS